MPDDHLGLVSIILPRELVGTEGVDGGECEVCPGRNEASSLADRSHPADTSLGPRFEFLRETTENSQHARDDHSRQQRHVLTVIALTHRSASAPRHTPETKVPTYVYRYDTRDDQRQLGEDGIAKHDGDRLIRILVWANEEEHRDQEPPESADMATCIKQEGGNKL